MADTHSHGVSLVLIADNAYRIAMLRRALQDAGVTARLQRVGRTRKTCHTLGGASGASSTPPPDLVLFDFAETDKRSCRVVTNLAFGDNRSRAPLVLLTSPESEALLDSGELDGGRATMFAPRPLDALLKKLADPEPSALLRALATLYQYGPILARQPARCLENGDHQTPLSA